MPKKSVGKKDKVILIKCPFCKRKVINVCPNARIASNCYSNDKGVWVDC